MKIQSLKIPEIKLIEPDIYKDNRGYFYESYSTEKFIDVDGQKILFVQDNQSFSKKNVLRGLHFQRSPMAQGKLVRVITGEIYDVAVDLREGSSTFGQWVGQILSGDNHLQLWIPEGFAHGFYCLKDSLVQYKTTSYYSPNNESTIRWDDAHLNINWPINSEPVVSSKDQQADHFEINQKYF